MSGTLKVLHGLRASHLECENSKGFEVGHNLVTVILVAPTTPIHSKSCTRPGQVISVLWASAFSSQKWKGKYLSPTSLEAHSTAVTMD